MAPRVEARYFDVLRNGEPSSQGPKAEDAFDLGYDFYSACEFRNQADALRIFRKILDHWEGLVD